MNDFSRRAFLKSSVGAAALTGISALALSSCSSTPTPAAKGKSVMGLVVPPMPEVRVGIIGVGERGVGFVEHFCHIDGARITAICDIDSQVLERAKTIIAKEHHSGKPVAYYGANEHSYRELLQRDDVDIVIIATPWDWHYPMAKDAMLAGKHAFVEVPMAL